MKIFGNICVGLVGLWVLLMSRVVSQSVTRYEFLVAAMLWIGLVVCYFALLFALTWIGKLDFLGWPRPLQYLGIVIASVSLSLLTVLSAALRGSEGHYYFPWSIEPFTPWAAVILPLALAAIGLLWLNSDRFGFPEKILRISFCSITAIAILSNIGSGFEIRRNIQRSAEEKARSDFAIVQQTDAEKDFGHLLRYTGRSERPKTRELALQKVVATGPKFNALLTECLTTPMFEEGLTYLRDNDPPGDAAPLAEPARDAILLSAKRLQQEIQTGRPVEADNIEARVNSVLVVADKFSRYGVDFVPAVREVRTALNAPKQSRVPSASLEKLDKWISAKSK